VPPGLLPQTGLLPHSELLPSPPQFQEPELIDPSARLKVRRPADEIEAEPSE
jgi:hypothetical protein